MQNNLGKQTKIKKENQGKIRLDPKEINRIGLKFQNNIPQIPYTFFYRGYDFYRRLILQA